MTDLFSPVTIGDYQLKNRIIMAPLTRARSLIGAVPMAELKAEYYSQRASAGLIIAEATAVSKTGLGWLDTSGMWNDEQQAAWAKVTRAVHDKNGKIFIQLWHMGAAVTTDFLDGQLPISSSNVNLSGEIRTPTGRKQALSEPRPIKLEDIPDVQQEYVDAAIRAIAAGFDGVEIHAANGFLIDQFTRDGSNKRQDEYGGSIDNRIRFALEIVDKTVQAIGAGKVGIRISPTNKVWGINDSNYRATFSRLVEKLNGFNLAYLHVLEPKPDSGHPMETIDYLTPELRSIYQGNLIANGGYTKASGDKAIATGAADGIAFGIPFIANPDLVERFKVGGELATPDQETFYTNDAIGYTDYPSMNATA
ncbi:alkene reductase [Agaribacter marinus]|uniref:Alkene reductase n=1 Tax=Agaribacter marinus TaxID=1431249 RepID=A0AA37SY41_9ALTE|nr:alkene reductase [Agaribacter marinus]GLR70260.1 alkene reductase [Agaribacter marinus]